MDEVFGTHRLASAKIEAVVYEIHREHPREARQPGPDRARAGGVPGQRGADTHEGLPGASAQQAGPSRARTSGPSTAMCGGNVMSSPDL
jgi:hypothetical protein